MFPNFRKCGVPRPAQTRWLLAHREGQKQALLSGNLSDDGLDYLPCHRSAVVGTSGQCQYLSALERFDCAQSHQVRSTRADADSVERSVIHSALPPAAGFSAAKIWIGLSASKRR